MNTYMNKRRAHIQDPFKLPCRLEFFGSQRLIKALFWIFHGNRPGEIYESNI